MSTETQKTFALIKGHQSKPRKIKDMIPVLADKSTMNGEYVIYEVYSNINEKEGLRYDVTYFHPLLLGEELAKTYGHYHKKGDNEITQVISGVGWYLLQKQNPDDPKVIEEAYLVEVKAGQKIIYPKGFGHVTINAQKDKELLTSNWINKLVEYDYDTFAQLQGACYYVFLKDGEIVFEKNENYLKVPELIRLRPKEIPRMGITFDKPLMEYTPDELPFLREPDKYSEILTIENCFERM